MGIDITSLEAIIFSQKFVTKKENMLTLARQHVHIPENIFNHVLMHNGIMPQRHYAYECETFFSKLGYKKIDSIDVSAYENASILHDLNYPINSKNNYYDYIYDGGTSEHVFNAPQLIQNVINMLSIDGIYCSVTCNNNFSGHGFYQYSPEFFLSAFREKYGMELLSLQLAQVNTLKDKWLDVKSYGNDSTGRNTTQFSNTNMVYIVIIAKKITNQRINLLENAPQQNSYENIDWKK